MMHQMTFEEGQKKVRVTWDDQAQAAYIRFFDGRVSKTEEVAPGLIADLSKAGRLLGLEILDPARVKPERVRRVVRRFGIAAISFNPARLPDLFVKA